MRIGIDVTSAMTEQPSGIAWVAVNLLKSFLRLGFDVVAFSRPRWRGVVRFPVRVRFATALSRFGAPLDCLLLTDTRDLPIKARIRLAIIHDIISLKDSDYAPPRFKAKKRKAYRLVCRRADAIITPSYAVAKEVSEKLPVPYGGVHPVAWGVDENFSPGRADEDVLSALSVKKPYILCVGTLCRRKRQAELVRIFRQKAPSTLRLVLVGRDGYGAVEVRESAAGADNIIITGHQEPGLLLHLYRGAEVVLNVSEYEGFCLPVYEASACGTAVVSTDVADIGRLLRNAAVIVNGVGEAVSAALSIIENRRQDKVGRKCLKAVVAIRWEETVKKIVAVLRRLLSRSQ